MGVQQFGSISAEVGKVTGCVTIIAGGIVVHRVTDAGHAARLISFWRRQSAAPCSGAMIEALKWAQARHSGIERAHAS